MENEMMEAWVLARVNGPEEACDSHRLRVAVAAGRGDRKLLRTLLRETGVSVVFFCTAPASVCLYTPLHMAAVAGHIGCVREILSWFATTSNCTISEYVDWTAEDGCTALHLAVGIRNLDIAKLLLNAGGNINIQNKKGLSPLHVAVIDDNLDMVKLLIDKGADVNAKDDKSWSCLHYVAGNGTTSVQHLDMVKLLVENGAFANATDAESRYSLHYAAEKGFCGIVKILAPLCSLARYDTNEKTALYLAAENGHDHCLKILAEAGACVNTRAADFTTPLMAATKNACDKCVEVLLNHKADPNLHCSRVWPQLPIHAAAKGLNENILKRLIAVTDRTVDRGEGMVSPVYEAVDNPPMLKLLLSEGFSPEGQDCRNLYEMDSPLALVLVSEDDTYELESVRCTLKMLMAAGASVTRDSWDVCLTNTVLLSALIHYRGYTRRKQQWRTEGLFGPSELQALQSVAAQNAEEAEFWLPTLLTAGLDPSVLLLPNFFRTADDKVLNYLLEMVNWSTLSPALTEVLQQRLRSKTWIPACPVDGFPSLLHLCRLKIRDILGSDILMRTNAVDLLPVPTLLRNFLTFSDILPPIH